MKLLVKILMWILPGGLNTLLVMRNLSYILFLGMLGMIYIANAHYAEKKVRRIQKLQKETMELKWNYLSIRSDIMYNSRQSVVARKVETFGLQQYHDKPILLEGDAE